MAAMFERTNVLTSVAVALTALTAALLGVAVIGSDSTPGGSGGAPIGPDSARCFLQVIVNGHQGYEESTCVEKGQPTTTTDAAKPPRYYCTLGVLGGDPQPAPGNDLANC